MRETYADIFVGFGGASLGAIAAGLHPIWGIEKRADVAEVANANLGGHVRVADILDTRPAGFDRPDVLHASPPCPNFSVAKVGAVETPLDIALARKVAEFVTVLTPEIFTLENVWAYRHSRSWRIIEDVLHGAGYWLSIEHVNFASMGVPQTRKRMIVRAVRGGWVPYLPAPVPWVSWYAAIEDLLPTLPESRFAPWQLARLPVELATSLISQGGYDGKIVQAGADEPAFTMTANSNQGGVRAFLVNGGQGDNGESNQHVTTRLDTDPACTITASEEKHPSRAWLCTGTPFGYGCPTRPTAEPAFTVTRQSPGWVKAFLMSGAGNTNFGEAHPGRGCRYEDAPAHTVTTITQSGGASPRAWLSTGRVVAMTPRALARFQSFPDWYELPEANGLAFFGIGNACSPLAMQRIYESLMEVQP